MEAASGWPFLCPKAKLCVHVSVAFLGSPSGDMSRSLLTIWWVFIFRDAQVGLASVAQWFTCEPGGHGSMSGHMPGPRGTAVPRSSCESGGGAARGSGPGVSCSGTGTEPALLQLPSPLALAMLPVPPFRGQNRTPVS